MKKSIFFVIIQFALNCAFGQAVTITPGIIGSNQDNSSQYNLELKAQNGGFPNLSGLAHNGTFSSPTAILANNFLLSIWGRGYDGSNFTTSRARIDFRASENWTSTSNGTAITFSTTPNGSTVRTERMRIENDGNVGIGTNSPLASLEVNRGTGVNGTAAFRGSTNVSHFNYSTAENTFLRGGKATSDVIINDVGNNVAIGNGTPLEKLHVFGNVRASSLVGTGVRNVYADANGTLTTTGNAVAFRAKRSNSYVLPANGGTNTLYFDDEEYDTSNSFGASTSSGIFTAPETGIYHFDISVVIGFSIGSPSTGQYVRLSIQNASNSELVFKDYYILNNETLFIISLNTDLKLSAGMQIRPVLYNQTLALVSPINGSATYFNGHLLR